VRDGERGKEGRRKGKGSVGRGGRERERERGVWFFAVAAIDVLVMF